MKYLNILAVALAVTFVSACDNGSEDDSSDSTAGTIWLLNLIEDSTTLGMEIAETRVAAVTYGQSSSRLSYISGEKEITFYKNLDDSDIEYLPLDYDLQLQDGDEFLLVLHGTLDAPQLDVIETALIDEDEEYGQIGFLHYATRAGAVDMYLTDEGEGIYASVPVATADQGHFAGMYTIDEGEYELRFTLSGDTEVLYDAGEVDVDEDSNSYYVLIDYVDSDSDTSLVVLELSDSGPSLQLVNDSIPAELRFVNGIADYPSVDVYLGNTSGEPLFSDVAFGEGTDYIEVEADDYSLNVTPHGVTDIFLYESPVSLTPGDLLSLVSSGLALDDDVTGNLIADSLRSIAGGAQLSFVHASPSNENLDIYLLLPGQPVTDASPVVSDLAFLLAFDDTVDAGLYEIVVIQSDNEATILGPIPVSLQEGDNVDYYLLDSVGGGTPGQLVEF